MFWKFKRRLRNGFCRSVFYYGSFVICVVLFMNIMTLQRNFHILEGENYVDAGGTQSSRAADVNKLESIDPKPKLPVFHEGDVHSRQSLRYVFENRLRKLLDIMENNLGNHTTSYNDVTDTDLSYETYFPDRLLYCDDVLNITDMVYMASGWTKAVYKGTFKGLPVAVKTVDSNGQDVQTCMTSGGSHRACYVKAGKKIVKEIVVLQALAEKNVLKVLGFCLPRHTDDTLWVAMVTELGEAVDLIKLLQMSWEERLRICLDITHIVNMMSDTPYGSMSMNDFRRQQFVLVDGALKLSDVDDAGFQDPPCNSNNDCVIAFSSSNFSQSSSCVHGRCVEYNEKKNLYNAGRHFVTFLLPHGAPATLRPIIDEVIYAYNNLTMTSGQLLQQMEKLTTLYQTGSYLNRTSSSHANTSYRRLPHMDMPGLHDYRCRLSLSMATCTVSVYDLREAEEMCNTEPQCQAFVTSHHKTWTGRTLIHLKNGLGETYFNANTSLYVRPA